MGWNFAWNQCLFCLFVHFACCQNFRSLKTDYCDLFSPKFNDRTARTTRYNQSNETNIVQYNSREKLYLKWARTRPMTDQIRVFEYSNEMMIAAFFVFWFHRVELLIDSRYPTFFLYSSGPSPPTYSENKTGYVYTTPTSRTYLPPVVGSSRQAKNRYTGALPKKLWRSSASCRIQCVSSSNEFQLTRETKK